MNRHLAERGDGMQQSSVSVLSILCDQNGNVQETIRDDFGVFSSAAVPRELHFLTTEERAGDFIDFIQKVVAEKAVFNYEINLNIQGRLQKFYLNGGTINEDILVVGSSANKTLNFFYDELFRINNQHTVNLRHTIKQLSREVLEKRNDERKRYDEFSALNNELMKLQRKLAKTNVDLSRSKTEADKANHAKSAFLATMSHEIRTPLNGIIGMAELLLNSLIPPNEKKAVNVIFDSSQILLAIINDILDLSKIEAGRMEFHEDSFNLKEVIEVVMQMVSERSKERGNTMYLYVDPHIAPNMLGDSLRLRQVLLNLINNAIKFTENGAVEIHVTLQENIGQNQLLHFEVRDTGIGIPKEDQISLFDPYYQSGADTDQRMFGTGLGLSISKRLVELMGGEIGVTSTLYEGSVFWFDLTFSKPDHQSSPDGVSKESVQPGQVDGKSLQDKELATPVLLAEDNKINQQVTLMQLKKIGFDRVDLVENGEEAVAAHKNNPYGLILMDNRMPVMDGFQAASSIREWEEAEAVEKRVPIIAMTANAMEGDREKCIAAGMDDYLVKPVRLKQLEEIFSKWLPKKMNSEQKWIDHERLQELLELNEDRSFVRELFETYKQDMPDRMKSLVDAYQSKDQEQCVQLAHDMKSGSVSMGVAYLSELFNRLEELARNNDLESSEAQRIMSQLEQAYESTCQALDRYV